MAAALILGLLFALYMANDDGADPNHGLWLFILLALLLLFGLAYSLYSVFLYIT
jgi:beta-lactamase regulating signal transducer with metallopeptidase domain